jgi:hypothetical protein
MNAFAKLVGGVCLAVLVACSIGLRAEDNSPAKPPTAKAGSAARAGSAKVKSISVKQLTGSLKSNVEEVRLRALALLTDATLQNAAATDAVFEFIERHADDGTVAVSVVRAIQIASQLSQPTITNRLADIMDSAEPPVSIVIADVLSTAKPPVALERIVALSKRDDYWKHFGLRRTVIDAAARYLEPSAVDFLIDMVNGLDGHLKYETARHLTRITGQSFGGFGEKWREWWNANRSAPLGGKGKELAAAGGGAGQAAAGNGAVAVALSPGLAGARMPWPEKVPEFYGVPVYAKKVAFVIDRSRSMASLTGGVSRLGKASDELEKAVESLSDYAEFTIYAFDSTVISWKPTLVPANDENKREAVAFTRRLFPRNNTNCYEALGAGLHVDGDLEAVYFLSDGVPTTGPMIEPFSIVETITAQNSFQRTTIVTFGIDARGIHEEFLKQLAEKNWGEFIQVR